MAQTEFERIAHIRRTVPADMADLLVGIGDDAAVLRPPTRPLVVTTDTMIEDVHFRTGWTTPRETGRKLAATNLSDIAAMGAEPRFATLAMALPKAVGREEFEELLRGVVERLGEYGAAIVGGDLTGSPKPRVLTLTLFGEAPSRGVLLRSGARSGDHLCVVGPLGDAALALRMSERGEHPRDIAERRKPPWSALFDPVPRCRLGRALGTSGLATAAIDISDGLVQDLGHLTLASGLVADLALERLPLSAPLRRHEAAEDLALAGGEDYALLFAVAPSDLEAVAALASSTPESAPISWIGVLRHPNQGERCGAVVFRRHGEAVRKELDGGFDHFRAGR